MVSLQPLMKTPLENDTMIQIPVIQTPFSPYVEAFHREGRKNKVEF